MEIWRKEMAVYDKANSAKTQRKATFPRGNVGE